MSVFYGLGQFILSLFSCIVFSLSVYLIIQKGELIMQSFEQYQIAHISASCEAMIKQLEQELNRKSGEEIVLIAYEEKKGTGN